MKAYDDYADALYRHCFFRVFSEARAEELVQDVFLKTWQYLADGHEIAHIRAFLYRVLGNMIIDEARRAKSESLDHLMEQGFEPKGDGEKNLVQGAEVREVQEALRRLPRDAAEVLVMRYVDDLEPKEIAEILDISPNRVSVRIHRALEALKKHVRE